MKFSLKWLKQYLDTQASPQEIAEKLVELGLEVESLDDPSARLQGFVYARVVECERHPNADRLSLCKVDAGSGELIQVVCGAPNVKANMGVVFAAIGTVIPATGDALKKGTIRNIESCGMLCSWPELLLAEGSDGIIDLGLDHKPGTPLTEILIITDALFDVAITPNRGDCFGVYGIARDLAAAGLGTLKKPEIAVVAEQGTTPTVSVETPLCTQFALRKISNTKNKDSLELIKDFLVSAGQKPISGLNSQQIKLFLRSVGQKSISGLVDLTNYFCIGFGRPMHVFDADKIKGNLVVREAQAGEILHALNDQDYVLSEGMVVIADDNGVVSLAGIMGGRETAVDEQTTNVLLESAVFDSVAIAKTGQRLNLISDSRMRFERGVDAAMILPCLDLATQMIVEQFGGTPAVKSYMQPGSYGQAIRKLGGEHPHQFPYDLIVGSSEINHHGSYLTITLDPTHVQKRLGLAIDTPEIIDILKALGCAVEAGALLKVTPPTWRHDLTIPEDLIEEVARLKGYGAIPAQSLPLMPAQTTTSRESMARQHLVSRGFLETLNWSFIDQATAQKFSEKPENLVFIANPISEELSVMRPSLVASLLKVAAVNNANARSNGAIFEIAPVHAKNLTHSQTACISGLRFGSNHDKHWLATTREVDVFDAKADALSLLKALGVLVSSMQIANDAPSYYHPGRKGALKQGNRVLAYFGEMHPAITDGLKAVAFEIFMDNLAPAKARKVQHVLSDLMPVHRDFAFVLDASIESEKLIKAVEKSSTLITQVDVFDCYQGSHVGDGKKSLAIAVTLQPVEKTLDEQSLTQVHDVVISAAAKIGAMLR